MPGRHLKESGVITQFVNCRVLVGQKIIREDLWVRNGTILNPEKLFFEEKAFADVKVDCGGALIAPGFIDLQINGAFGVDFSLSSDTLANGVKSVAKGLLAHGVTSFCPTLVTSPPEVYGKILPQLERTKGNKDGATILGVHLEGPFINKEKKGAHPENFIRSLENGTKDLEVVYGRLDNVSIVTLAPEIEGALEVVSDLAERGITVSVGHSMANLKQGEEAVRRGARFITHLFNAMLPFHHRDPHLVGLLASHKLPSDCSIYYGLIADGIHTHPAALRIAHRTHPQGVVLVTDAIPAMGLATGTHHIGHQVVEIRDKKAMIAGTNTLCGSIATMNECVKYFYQSTECSRVEALEAAALHPARVFGLEHIKGSLEFGCDADLVILTDELDVVATFISGEMVWQKQGTEQLKFSST